jgi:acetylornithine deacetylase/succinyl-diaminopimelate desuccinylase-like protein
LTGPSVGDNSVALAALTHLTEILPADFDSPLWIAATVGEEGLGNLNGVINLLDNPPATFAYVIALEGNYLGRVNITGVGSARYLVELDGPGGHSWEESHQPNAVEAAAHFVTAYRRLFDAKIAELHGKATLNFGTIFGGESVNSRAKGCAFSVDLRAEDAGTLAAIQELLESERGDHFDDFEVTVTALGIRPAGSIEPDHPLVRAAVEAANRHGLEPTLSAASTDANAAYARGLPAITLGVAFGGDTHTLREWIDISSIDLGVTILADTLIALTTLEG